MLIYDKKMSNEKEFFMPVIYYFVKLHGLVHITEMMFI